MTRNDPPSLDSTPTVAEEAARWFVRLQESSATPQTFREWQQWLSAEPEHRQIYDQMEMTALRISRTPAMPALPSAAELAQDTYDGTLPLRDWKCTSTPAEQSQTRPWWPWNRFAIAAALALLALGAGWLLLRPTAGLYPRDIYRTSAGQRHTLILPEGSRVTLDAGSVLEVNLTAQRRSLKLERGEAYFQVAKDRQRPFVVQAGSANVTAVGTAFNVRMSEDRTVVAVTEGKVEFFVAPGKDTMALSNNPNPSTHAPASSGRATLAAEVSAGEAVSYVDDGRLQALPAQAAPLATSWLEGRRQYRDEPLRYVLTDLDRYTGQRIRLDDPAVGDLHFTGTINLQNSAAWLRGLSVALPVSITEDGDGVLVVKHR